LKEEMSPFFSAVAELAESRGFEVAGVKGGALNLNLNGEFASAVDETGAMNYHPYKEVFDMMDEVLKIREEIPYHKVGYINIIEDSLAESYFRNHS
jgi:hypothetical protein